MGVLLLQGINSGIVCNLRVIPDLQLVQPSHKSKTLSAIFLWLRSEDLAVRALPILPILPLQSKALKCTLQKTTSTHHRLSAHENPNNPWLKSHFTQNSVTYDQG